MKNSLRPPVDKSDIHFTLLVGACLWVKENNIQLNEKWMQSSLKCRQSVVNSFFFFFLSSRSTISSGPSPRSRYTARSGTTWLSPSPRQSATSRTMSPSTPGSSRCQSSLFTYSVSSRPLCNRIILWAVSVVCEHVVMLLLSGCDGCVWWVQRGLCRWSRDLCIYVRGFLWSS